MKRFEVKIPIAGHLTVEVEADSVSEAENKALKMTEEDGYLTWETLYQFNNGNTCYCPQPWQTEVEEINDYEN